MPRLRSNQRRAAPVTRPFGGVEGRNPGPLLTIDLHDNLLLSYAGKIFQIAVSAEECRQFAAACMGAAERIDAREARAKAEGTSDV